MGKGDPKKMFPNMPGSREYEKREAYNLSTEKAKELKTTDWGTLTEVEEMARMPNSVKSFAEARGGLEQIVDKPLKDKSGQVIATLSNNSVDKILSKSALQESMNTKAHLLASANLEKLYSNAIEKWKFEFDPNKNNENLRDRKYLYSPMKFGNRIVSVKFTVKLFKDKRSGQRIYSMEVIDEAIKK